MGWFRYPEERKAARKDRRSFEWTDERVAALLGMWRGGTGLAEIRETLGHGVTRNAVTGKLHRLGGYPRVVDSVSGTA